MYTSLSVLYIIYKYIYTHNILYIDIPGLYKFIIIYIILIYIYIYIYIYIIYYVYMHRANSACDNILVFAILLQLLLCHNSNHHHLALRVISPRYQPLRVIRLQTCPPAGPFDPYMSQKHRWSERWTLGEKGPPTQTICGVDTNGEVPTLCSYCTINFKSRRLQHQVYIFTQYQ